jgi:hypothetical protein
MTSARVRKYRALTISSTDGQAQASADFDNIKAACHWLIAAKRSGRVLENRGSEYFAVAAVKNGEAVMLENTSAVPLDDRRHPSVGGAPH